MLSVDVICLAETWLKEKTYASDLSMLSTYYQHLLSKGRGNGLAMFTKPTILSLTDGHVHKTHHFVSDRYCCRRLFSCAHAGAWWPHHHHRLPIGWHQPPWAGCKHIVSALRDGSDCGRLQLSSRAAEHLHSRTDQIVIDATHQEGRTITTATSRSAMLQLSDTFSIQFTTLIILQSAFLLASLWTCYRTPPQMGVFLMRPRHAVLFFLLEAK